MIPARSVLATWRTTELAELGESFRTDGNAVCTAGDKVGQQIASLKHWSAWGGDSQPAAASAADRVGFFADCLGCIGTSIAQSFDVYGTLVASERTKIDQLVGVIEKGSLYVTDEWQVLVRVEKMTPDMAKLMALAAQGFQDQLNSHLRNLGNADNEFAAAVRRNTNSSWLGINLSEEMDQPGSPKNVTGAPYDEGEREKQQQALEKHMFGTVVGKKISHDGDKVITELQMLDGSRQVHTSADNGNRPVSFDLYDPKGALVSHSVKQDDGTVITTLQREGKSPITVTKRPGKDAVASVDGKNLVVSEVNDLWDSAKSTFMSGTPHIDQYADSLRKGSTPFLDARRVGRLALGADMASATITVLSTAYYVATADNYYEACEAGLRGTGGGIGSVLANMVMPDGWTAFAKSMVGGTVGSYLGGKMAPWVCTR
ncbi:hypothetical protein GII30_15665 [Gordonia amarae]|uniref:Uncharacterized protein n=2 Tax=Gordonia amarae TaxID=36821 RepID=G7GK61_9ACTN|nr:hypothetical protein [Gordonia amarae]MCS3879844.1 hypothetical protein [Gordonia amarae]QHN18261.1 hypothetical protein GII35_15975 [Gordonia amarae]QHN22745.1 hypothetical protein GII34_15520 [Gordonia amarae]QHN31649.1 hypothetical protein GII32_15830 [Gordonia amarae]QHN40393.1 hypothetical protein GII30_15665 [Gordonia amarae]